MTFSSLADEIARTLADEVPRERVVSLLDQRWRKSLTLLSAPGGYGKTRALAQAVRSNEEDPVGIEFYVRSRPGDVDPARLGQAMLSALGARPEREPDEADLADRITDELAAFSPSNVSLVIDDVHHLESSAAACALLSAVIRQLPVNGHLVLAGRTIPELPLARLEADDAVIRIDDTSLVFDADELQWLAERHDVDAETLSQLAGWPALVRLAVVAGRAGPHEFLMQEIVNDLAPSMVQGLTVVVLAGQADKELMDRCKIEVSPSQLGDLIPMVDVSAEGVVRAHDLWADVLLPAVAPAQRSAYVAEIVPWHSENFRHDDAIMLATGQGEHEIARTALMRALEGADTNLRAASTGRWLDLFGGSDHVAADDAELLLLRGWYERLANGPGCGDEDIAQALAVFHDRGDHFGEAQASVEHAFRGFLAGDVGPVLDAVERSKRLLKHGVTYLQPLGAMTDAVIHELAGDFAQALECSLRAVGDKTPHEFAELALRHRATLCFLVGDSAAAIHAAQELVALSPSARNLVLQQLAAFAHGDVDALVEAWPEIRYGESGNKREDFSHAVASVFIDACLGLTPELSLVRSVAWDRPREQLQLALCEWSALLLDGNETRASEQLRSKIAELGLEDPLVRGDLHRFAVSVYVADPAIRDHLDDPEVHPPLGEYQRRLRGLGRLLVALRDGTTADWSAYLGPDHTLSSMSLPWSVEIACALVSHDKDRGVELAERLFSVTGVRAQYWLRSLAASGTHAAEGASYLLSELPAHPGQATMVQTQGVVGLQRDSETHPVSRIRVRQLLLLLLLRGSISRGVAMTLLWPEKDTNSARNNLRITLSHLRGELEPDRQSGEPSYHLRQRGDVITLWRSEYLDADLWQILDGLAKADAAAAIGDRSAQLSALGPVAAQWTPPVLKDLAELADVGAEVAALQARLRDATVEVAAACLATARYDEAEQLGRKLLSQNSFDERAHAIVIAAYLGAERQAQAHHAIDECLAMLRDLGVQAAPSTRMLLRRARYPEDETRRTA